MTCGAGTSIGRPRFWETYFLNKTKYHQNPHFGPHGERPSLPEVPQPSPNVRKTSRTLLRTTVCRRLTYIDSHLGSITGHQGLVASLRFPSLTAMFVNSSVGWGRFVVGFMSRCDLLQAFCPRTGVRVCSHRTMDFIAAGISTMTTTGIPGRSRTKAQYFRLILTIPAISLISRTTKWEQCQEPALSGFPQMLQNGFGCIVPPPPLTKKLFRKWSQKCIQRCSKNMCVSCQS